MIELFWQVLKLRVIFMTPMAIIFRTHYDVYLLVALLTKKKKSNSNPIFHLIILPFH